MNEKNSKKFFFRDENNINLGFESTQNQRIYRIHHLNALIPGFPHSAFSQEIAKDAVLEKSSFCEDELDLL